MKKKIIGLITIAAIASVAMFVGCIEEEVPISTPIPTPTLTGTPITTPIPTVEEACEVICNSSSMGWGLSCENASGGVKCRTSCSREYDNHGRYIETCTGTYTYINSGNAYNATVVYDRISDKIFVNVEGVGECSD
jgi:hypothetical protein